MMDRHQRAGEPVSLFLGLNLAFHLSFCLAQLGDCFALRLDSKSSDVGRIPCRA